LATLFPYTTLFRSREVPEPNSTPCFKFLLIKRNLLFLGTLTGTLFLDWKRCAGSRAPALPADSNGLNRLARRNGRPVSDATPSSGKDQAAHVHPYQSPDNNSRYLSHTLSDQHAAVGCEGQTDRSSYRDHYRHHFSSEISGGLLIESLQQLQSRSFGPYGCSGIFQNTLLAMFHTYISYLRFMS